MFYIYFIFLNIYLRTHSKTQISNKVIGIKKCIEDINKQTQGIESKIFITKVQQFNSKFHPELPGNQDMMTNIGLHSSS